jgi:hypothetical protein
MRQPLIVLLISLAAAGAAQAGTRIYSFDPADAATRQRVDKGLTFIFDRGMVGMRVKEVLATEARARAKVEPVGERGLGVKLDQILPRGANAWELYEIVGEDQGPAMIRAFCPGSTKGWLVFSAIRPRRELTVHALGDDGAGKARLCATLKLSYRGEWSTGQVNGPSGALTTPFSPSRPN